MLDEVVDKVGEENVVQVVIDNATNYKLAREMLMQKRMLGTWQFLMGIDENYRKMNGDCREIDLIRGSHPPQRKREIKREREMH